MTNPNDPAFEPLIWKQIPLTKREFFAVMAMQGLCADPERTGDHATFARDAIKFADALTAELNKPK